MLASDNVAAACQRDEKIAVLCGFIHRGNGESVHDRLDRLYGVNLGDGDDRAHSARAHRRSASAPAVSRDNYILARDYEICRIHYAVKCGLSRTVAVIEKMLAIGIVYVDHREIELSRRSARKQAVYSRGGLLGTADQVLAEVAPLSAKQIRKISAVVDYKVRLVLKRHEKMAAVSLFINSVTGENLDSVGHGKRRRNVVLR